MLPIALFLLQVTAAESPRAVAEIPLAPLPALLAESDDLRVYNDHVVTLASPFMEGRLPGTRGMERAKEYVEFYFLAAGLEAPFQNEDGSSSFRQPFELAGPLEVRAQRIEAALDGDPWVAGEDYIALGLGGSGALQGDVVFVGYSITGGPDGYEAFDGSEDLEGKIALMLRFEPMDADGKSRWAESGPWSPRASFRSKLLAVSKQNPAAIVIANPPGSADPRAGALGSSNLGAKILDVPVFLMSIEAAESYIAAADPEGRSLLELRQLADEGRAVIPMELPLDVEAELDRTPLIAENVGGLLRGRGRLADELIVVGGHLDHLGQGNFGSRSGPGELHPGADDNASGAAAILMLGQKLVDEYAAMDSDADARSILFITFSAEESGLNGSNYYTSDPIFPIEDHALMINFDMIGRLSERRIAIDGGKTGDGMSEWLAPFFEASPLEVVVDAQLPGGSDHIPFLRKGVPYLFGIVADVHNDYHTPRDISALINRTDAVHTVTLFHEILRGTSTLAERFEFVAPVRRSRITLGVRLGPQDGNGILIAQVTEKSSAALAGIQPGDRLISWKGEPLNDISALRRFLGSAQVGDKVPIGIQRGAEELILVASLKGS